MARTETVTVIFTDIVGSTELASRLGHDAYERLRQHHFGACRTAIAEHGGSEVKSLGDGLMLCFPSVADAVACAVAMQQASCLSGEGAEHLLQIRVGVSSGEATREGQDLYGPPVVEASRLCAAAASGQILVSDVVRLLARGKGQIFTPLGELNLKGIADPVVACEVKWEPPRDTRHVMALPPRLAALPPQGLFGRGIQQELLAKAWAAAQTGERRVILLAGEPGIGKTRLAGEMARKAHGEGATVLFGLCDEDVSLPYRPFVEAIRHYVFHAPDHVLAAHVRVHQAELTRLIPELRNRIAGLPAPQMAEAETKRFLLFEAVLGLLSAAAQDAPVVLVLDDLQWAGAADLLLLKHIVSNPLPMRLLIIGTFRDTDLSKDHPLTPLLADWRRQPGVERLALGGIDEAAVQALIAASAGHELHEPGRALAHALHRDTEGSPFFITEILRNFIEAGTLFREEERWTYKGDVAGLGIPDGIKDVIGRRLGRLSGASNRVLTPAAVIGRQFDLALLSKVSDQADGKLFPEDIILDCLDEATSAAVVNEIPGEWERFGFSHALIRSTLYEGLNSVRRRRLHRRVGEALEALTIAKPQSRVDELAYHWLASADASDNAKAIAYARQAAEKAAASLAFEAAIGLYERALGVLEPVDRDGELLRCDLLLGLGDVQRSAGDARFRQTMESAAVVARQLGDAHRLGLAAVGSGHPGGVQWGNAVDQSLVSLYSEAIAGLGDGEGELRARLLGQLAIELKYGPERQKRHSLSAEALGIARRGGDRLTLARALSARIFAIEDPTTLVERLQMTAELETLAAALGHNELGCLTARQRFVALLESGDAVGAERALARCAQLAAQLRVPFFDCFVRFVRTMWALMRGEPDAEQQIFSTFQAGVAIRLPQAGNALGAQMFELRARQGRLGEQLDAIRTAVKTHPNVSAFHAALVFSLCETGALDEAQEHMEQLIANDFSLPLDMNWPGTINFLSEACGMLRNRQAAKILYPRLKPVAEQVGVTAAVRCDGSLAHPAGILASCLQQWADAEMHFEFALEVNDRIGARIASIRTRRAYASMLIERNFASDHKRAADLISAGLGAAASIEMPAETAKLENLRQSLG